jgi:molybdopterin-guanine dinucleotide biosynthesis protein A
MDHVGAAILCGGRASRLAGVDKCRLPVGGVPIIERQIAVLRLVAPAVLVIGGRPDAAADPSPGVEHVPDALPGRGPLGGIYTALRRSEAAITLIVAGDMPFLSAPFLQHLVATVGVSEAAVPRSSDGWHPLCAAYARTVLPIVEAHLACGRLAVVDLLSEVRVAEIGPEVLARFDPERTMLSNVNTRQDYELACARADRA